MRNEDRAGLELTIIIHLVALIVLLILGIGTSVRQENSFILDFSGEELRELEKKKEELQNEVSRKLDELIANGGQVPEKRNIAVNATLKDDRNSTADAEQLYKDAKRLENDLKKGHGIEVGQEAPKTSGEQEEKKEEEKAYSGPSVLSWTMEGRKACHLPIPAYRCYGEGVVTVFITIDKQGKVVNVAIDDLSSDSDSCLREFARKAAKASRFTADLNAPSRQVGSITYSFIAQR